MSKFLAFRQVGSKIKKKRLIITASNKSVFLGRIQWYKKWGQFVFIPGNDTMWSRASVREIQRVLKQLDQERRKQL